MKKSLKISGYTASFIDENWQQQHKLYDVYKTENCQDFYALKFS